MPRVPDEIRGKVVEVTGHPKLTGWDVVVHADPIKGSSGSLSALRVVVETVLGRRIIEMRACRAELEQIDAPDPRTGSIRAYPGSIWFYTSRGDTVGILPDANALNYQIPGAVVKPRSGSLTGERTPE